jgi:3-oxoacyl-[acyl-carrier protein] reductase
MTGLLDGKVAIITGAGRGIGASAAKLFAEHRAKVVVSDIDNAPAQEVVADIRSAGGDAVEICGDITDPDFPGELISQTLAKYNSIDIIVNNAGYTWDGMLHKMTDEQFRAMLEVHNTAPFRLIKAAAPHMRDAAKKEKAEGGEIAPRCIVNVSSTSGLHGNIGQINYATAKMGIIGMTKTIAREWGPFGIRCNAVAYGFIDTRLTASKQASSESIEVGGQKVQLGIPEKTRENVAYAIPLGRGGTADEAANAILFLASPMASYITGHTLEVTGGMGI